MGSHALKLGPNMALQPKPYGVPPLAAELYVRRCQLAWSAPLQRCTSLPYNQSCSPSTRRRLS